MWRRFTLALGTAVILALGASSTFAVNNTDATGYAALGSGGAYVQKLANSQTRVQVRLTGLTPGSQPVWQLLTGSTCGGAVGTVLVGPSTPATISSLGLSMTSSTFPVVVPANGGSPTFVAIRVYASV